MKYFILFYDYVDGMLEKRGPYRPAHLDYLKTLLDAKKLIVSGPLVDPVDGAALVFQVGSAAEMESIAQNDPFMAAGLIKAWRAREWDVAMGKENLKDFSA